MASQLKYLLTDSPKCFAICFASKAAPSSVKSVIIIKNMVDTIATL